VHIIRTSKIPFFQSRASRTMTATTLFIMAVGIWIPYSPFAHFFGLVPLPAVFFLWITGFLVAYSVLTHLVKSWFIRRFGID